ncbi:hypothetical protein E2C01_052368 [Portunus trituberculatus]|uniref:Uncharacterized protein n=1 Tax=Portunus trituberculatus TaxID=210409 RepID=A0A5B7GLQ7_PORTR|nr:hypothetical protein [Portunus trituberculatus]
MLFLRRNSTAHKPSSRARLALSCSVSLRSVLFRPAPAPPHPAPPRPDPSRPNPSRLPPSLRNTWFPHCAGWKQCMAPARGGTERAGNAE